MRSPVLTGMPAAAYAPTMMIELAIYGLVIGLMMHFVHTGKQLADIYISLLTAMLSGRILTGIVRALIFAKGTYTIQMWATGYFVSCFPAILLQLVLVPILYTALQKAGIIPARK